jgi:hypothetical protein
MFAVHPSVRLVLLGTLTMLAGSGCLERRLAPLHPELGIQERVRLESSVADVDLLLVIDDSNSMEEEQRNLAARVEDLVRDLVEPPDADGDGVTDWGAVTSLRVGVVSTDLGTTGAAADPRRVGEACLSGPAGERALFGHDGRLEPSGTCGSGAGVIAWAPGDDPGALAAEVACVVESLGVEGCGIEGQAGAAARALARREGSDFPRPDSVLAVLVLTDEEDCTLADPEAFFAAMDSTNANVLCQRSPELLTSVQTLAAGLRGDRPDARFVFSVITGVPLAMSGRSPSEILADPGMAYEEVTNARGAAVPRAACSVEGLGDAAPARRLVALAETLGAERVHSICTDDFRPAIADLTTRIGRALDGACLARRVAPGPDGTIQCTLEERLPAGTGCTDLPGRVAARIDDEGRSVCSVAQATASGTPGWRYDPSDARCARIEYTEGAAPPPGTELDVRCWFPIEEDDPRVLGP